MLLLATRMAVDRGAGADARPPGLRNEWLQLLGRGTTHHLVLLDDSYSMSDRWDEHHGARRRQTGRRRRSSTRRTSNPTRSWSRCCDSPKRRELSAGAQPKVFAEPINDTFRSKLESLLAGWEPSQTDVGPADALKAIPRLPLADERPDADPVSRERFPHPAVRQRHRDPQAARRPEGRENVAQIHLVRCVREARPNLAITSLEPESGVRAAGVEMWMSVTVANYGDAPARGVTVQLEQDGDALPALALDDIPPRDEITHKFRVQFAGIGAHWLSASLGADAVDVDNRRYFACDLPAARPVLIVDGSQDGRGGRQLSLALAPGGNTRTGWQPHVEPASFLADGPKTRANKRPSCLLDVPRLADDELAALEKYVAQRRRRGIVRRLANRTATSTTSGSIATAKDCFPRRSSCRRSCWISDDETTPDVEVTEHPLFQVLAGRRNGFLPLVMVDYYYALPNDWTPPTDGIGATCSPGCATTRRSSSKRNSARAASSRSSPSSRPATRRSAAGRNWSLNPAFPVLANELVGLPRRRAAEQIRCNWSATTSSFACRKTKYDPAFRFILPGDGTDAAGAADRRDGRETAS